MKVFVIVLFWIVGTIQDVFSQGQVTDSVVYDFVEEYAEFPGGADFLHKWIAKNFELPQEVNKSEQGKIYLSFVIEKDGSVSNIRITRGLSEKLNNEAIKLVQKMPSWKPAINNGKPVRSRFMLPISVVL